MVDVTRFQESIEDLRVSYASAFPWPHVIIDNFLPDEVADRVSAAFPQESGSFSKLALFFGARSYRPSVPNCPPMIEAVLKALETPAFSAFVGRITDIDGLAADNTRAGSGFHQGARGSHLRIHADHNVHPNGGENYRRVNLMIYLTRNWKDHWNGDLELWDRAAEHCEKRITPKFNRCIIFGVDDTAYHGYGPLRIPFDQTRNALAAYYYASRPAPGQSSKAHGTEVPQVSGESISTRVRFKVRGLLLWQIKKLMSAFDRD